LDESSGFFRTDLWDRLYRYFSTTDREAILRRLGIDFRRIWVEPTTAFKESAQWVGVPMDGYFKILPNGTYEDEWGIRYELTSDRLHWRYIYHPLATAESPNEIELPSLDAPGRFDAAVKTVKAMREEYVIEAFPFVTLYETGWALRGFNRFNLDLIQNSAFIEKLLDKLLKLILEMVARFVEAGADVIQLGDDFGMQTSMLVSPTLWRRFFKPRMKIVVDGIKKRSHNSAYVFYHSCGYIEPIIPELIEVGVEILNPIQPEAMNPAKIKDQYGDKVALHGTISIQKTLPFGTPEDVRNEVLERIETCGQGGGLVIAPAHTPQPEVTARNLVALYETAQNLASSSNP